LRTTDTPLVNTLQISHNRHHTTNSALRNNMTDKVLWISRYRYNRYHTRVTALNRYRITDIALEISQYRRRTTDATLQVSYYKHCTIEFALQASNNRYSTTDFEICISHYGYRTVDVALQYHAINFALPVAKKYFARSSLDICHSLSLFTEKWQPTT
jgi:hypothetical protein